MILEDLTSMIKLPRMVKVRQHFDRPMVEDLPGEIRRQMESSGVLERVKPGYRVALTAGSRQINNFPLILKEVITILRSMDANLSLCLLWAATAELPLRDSAASSPAWA